ncbi:phosphate transport system permease protein [Bowdeniella nasicola]|uniref:Phosphate transport system permease protein n=1 Tax=Bowdeniella nasicola TaxID=208480 RepID=A0A1H3X2K6_9ACTO|nr:phosphate ABC transporter permease subunit PstC [Bowdeniella nasicola]SDZ93626.1 phosphate transport system permease protein [Bowdeniella nasicola]
MTTAPSHPQSTTPKPTSSKLKSARGTGKQGNKIFSGVSTGAALMILGTLAAVAAFLIYRAWPALTDSELRIRTVGSADTVSLAAFTGPQIFGTLLSAFLAMLIAVPVSVGIALFISHYAPRRVAATLGYLVDLLAAIPSVLYGLWGGVWLLPRLLPVYEWLSDYLGFIPLFRGPVSASGKVMASVAIILAVMILPIITAVAREVFLQTPKLHEEAALALGATRWEMIKMAVLPFGRSGIVSASMLGLGRALGETMAVVMVLGIGSTYSWEILKAGQHSTIAANIALQFPESNAEIASALIATGLALFVITMVVNMAARAIIARRAEFSGAN